METDQIRTDTDSDISNNHIYVSFQFPSLRMETDRIRTDTNSDISDIFGYPFSYFLTVSIPTTVTAKVLVLFTPVSSKIRSSTVHWNGHWIKCTSRQQYINRRCLRLHNVDSVRPDSDICTGWYTVHYVLLRQEGIVGTFGLGTMRRHMSSV